MSGRVYPEDRDREQLRKYLSEPEEWERCAVPMCRAWRHGVVCKMHWKRLPRELRAEIKAARGNPDAERAALDALRRMTDEKEPNR